MNFIPCLLDTGSEISSFWAVAGPADVVILVNVAAPADAVAWVNVAGLVTGMGADRG
jgi:hypothetical protein